MNSRSILNRGSSPTSRRSKTYEPVPLTPKEDELRKSGGIVAVGRREFRSLDRTIACHRVSRSVDRAFDDDDRADHLGASRGQGAAAAQARRHAARLRRSASGVGWHRAVCDPHLQPDHWRPRDLPAAGGDRQRSLRLHRTRGRRQADKHRARVRARAGIEAALLRHARRRHLPLLLSRSRASCCPDSSFPAPTLTAARMARTAQSAWAWARRRSGSGGRRATSTSRWRRLDASSFSGALQPWVSGKDIVLELLAPLGQSAVAGDVGRVRRSQSAAADCVSQHDRQHDGRGRSAQRHLRGRRYDACVVCGEGDRRPCRTHESLLAATRDTRSTRSCRSTMWRR